MSAPPHNYSSYNEGCWMEVFETYQHLLELSPLSERNVRVYDVRGVRHARVFVTIPSAELGLRMMLSPLSCFDMTAMFNPDRHAAADLVDLRDRDILCPRPTQYRLCDVFGHAWDVAVEFQFNENTATIEFDTGMRLNRLPLVMDAIMAPFVERLTPPRPPSPPHPEEIFWGQLLVDYY